MPQTIDTKEVNIDFLSIFNTLSKNKIIIAVITGFFALTGYLYLLNIPIAPYIVSAKFITTSDSDIFEINRSDLNETAETVLGKFLTRLASKKNQTDIFINGNFLTKFNTLDEIITDDISYAQGSLSSILIQRPLLKNKEIESMFLDEKPYVISIEGANPAALSEYLVALLNVSDKQTIDELEKARKQKINYKINQLISKIKLLEDQTKADRFSEIQRIKENDGKKISDINDSISREIEKHRNNRLNEIQVLIDSASLAKSLGVFENNFNQITMAPVYYSTAGLSQDPSEAGDNQGENERKIELFPKWYLYGEKALLQKIKVLENRISDSPLTKELINLQYELDQVKNNNDLKVLEQRTNDAPFIKSYNRISIEIKKLKNDLLQKNNPYSSFLLIDDTLIQDTSIDVTSQIMFLSVFLGLSFGSCLVLIREAFTRRKFSAS